MSPLRIALLQLVPQALDVEANLETGLDWCRRAAAEGADIALFPEMWSTGYEPAPPDRPEVTVATDSTFVKAYRAAARELDMAIAITYLEAWEGLPRNTLSLIDRTGAIVLTYAKVHTCDFDVEIHLTPGDSFDVATLDTRLGPVEVGAMICYDREFPESARILMLKGAEVILVPNSCPLEQTRLLLSRARALENMLVVATANYASPKENGHSAVYGPIAFDEQGNSLDNTILEAGEREGIFMATIDLDELRAYRERETWGNSYRKPATYEALTSSEVAAPFVRSDSRR